MAKSIQKKRQVIAKLEELFRSRGFAATSLSDLSAATGLGRASLYHHFPGGKTEMGQAVLAQAGQAFAQLVIAPLGSEGSPREQISAMLDGLERFYGAEAPGSLMNSMTLGGDGAAFGPAIAAAVNGWLERMVATFQQAAIPPPKARAMAEDVVVSVEGGLVLARLTGDGGAFLRALERLRERLL